MAIGTSGFETVRSEGGLLPPDLLRRVLDPREKLVGTSPDAYGLPQGERLTEVITPAWNRLRKHWSEFREAAASLPKGDAGTGLTNEKWTLPLLRELGFGLLPTSIGPEIAGHTYAISRFFGPVPIHLVGCGLSLDRRAAGVRGAAAANPHGLVQAFLNRRGVHLWGIVSNGLRLRVLRDSQSLSRQSFLEFDLETMFTGELYSDFALLWAVVHATRFAPRLDQPGTCWLEIWTEEAEEQGARALGDLRTGVESALQILGQGLSSHPNNVALRDQLRTGKILPNDFHGQLLRVIYRLIFLFVAEDRTIDGAPLLHPRDETEQASIARQRYAAYYSTTRLRGLASSIKGSRHTDLWRQLQIIVGALSGSNDFAATRDNLALPVLGSLLWEQTSTAALNNCELANHDLLDMLRQLAFTRQGNALRPVDFKNLGAEELGGVYESLLALTPQISADGASFTFADFAGNERKTSGSYYTPDSLVQCLLDSALEPVVEKVIGKKTGLEAERALLALKICDPAVGSGHFLVGAAHRLARRLSGIRSFAQGESEPSPLLYQHALRDVIGRCLYGVDLNPMAAELCRVSLWLEALDPGRPLSFLDHHIRVGNSLLGSTPELIASGIPDSAFMALEGDDKRACVTLRKRNAAERRNVGPLFAEHDAAIQARLEIAAAALEEMPDDKSEDIKAKEIVFRSHLQAEDYLLKKRLADAWCSAFVIPKFFPTLPDNQRFKLPEPFGITQRHLIDLSDGRLLNKELDVEIDGLLFQYHFFHWHLEFPEVFAKGGFDCVLGNPPWDMQEVKDNEFFAASFPELLSVKSAKDKALVLTKIRLSDPQLWDAYQQHVRVTDGQRHLMANTGRFPLSSTGRLNLARLFLETGHTIVGEIGRVGMVLPSGFASDSFSQDHFAALHGSGRLISLYDFENRLKVFPDVHSSYRFCLLTVGATGSCSETDFVYFAQSPLDLSGIERHIHLSQKAVSFLNPLTQTAPLFRTRHDYALAVKMQMAGPIIGRTDRDDSWRIKPTLMFMMNAEMKGHRTAEELEKSGYKLSGNQYVRGADIWLPLYEGKMVGMYDHRAASIRFDPSNRVRRNQPMALSDADHEQPDHLALPMFWVNSVDVAHRCGEVPRWCVTIKDITSATNERTSIAAMLAGVALTDSLPWLSTPQSAALNACLLANLNSFAFDYAARQKVAGLHLRGHYLNQLPVIDLTRYESPASWATADGNLCSWVLPRVVELTYTAWDLELFARDCNWQCPPFRWDEQRRLLLRCELDAAFFHLYLPADSSGKWQPAEDETLEERDRLEDSFSTPRDAVAYIMDTFPIVSRKDEEQWGSYYTKLLILDIYDAMSDAIGSKKSYASRIQPPAGDPRYCHQVT